MEFWGRNHLQTVIHQAILIQFRITDLPATAHHKAANTTKDVLKSERDAKDAACQVCGNAF